MPGTDRRCSAGEAPTPERHAPLVVVGAGVAGVAAAIEAARAGVEVLLVDEHPVDNDMMAMDVPLCFGQRMDPSVRNRARRLERVVETNPGLASAYEAGVDVQLGTYVWGAFVNGPAVQELPGPMLGLADDRRSWLVGYDRLIVAAGARDVLLGFAGWERAGTLGAGGAAALLARYRALAARRLLVMGSGALGLHTAALALEHGVEVAGVVEVGARVRGPAATAKALAGRGVPFFTAHTIQEARGRTGEIESVVLVAVDGVGKPVGGGAKEIACDAVCWAVGLVPGVELLSLVGARLRFVGALGGWVPEVDASLRTSVPTVFAAGDCAGFHEGRLARPDVAPAEGRRAGEPGSDQAAHARGHGAVPEPALPGAGGATARPGRRDDPRPHPAPDLPAAGPPAAAERPVADGRAGSDARGLGELVRHPHAVQPALDGGHGDRRADGARPPDPER